MGVLSARSCPPAMRIAGARRVPGPFPTRFPNVVSGVFSFNTKNLTGKVWAIPLVEDEPVLQPIDAIGALTQAPSLMDRLRRDRLGLGNAEPVGLELEAVARP